MDGRPRSAHIAATTGNTLGHDYADCKSVGVCLQWFESTTCHSHSDGISAPAAFSADRYFVTDCHESRLTMRRLREHRFDSANNR